MSAFLLTSNISDIVTDIIGDRSRVTRVVFWNSVNNFSDKIGAYISSLGVDTTSDAAKLLKKTEKE